LKLPGGLVVTDVRPDSKADVRKGDVLLTWCTRASTPS
jgi:hypothetical protein